MDTAPPPPGARDDRRTWPLRAGARARPRARAGRRAVLGCEKPRPGAHGGRRTDRNRAIRFRGRGVPGARLVPRLLGLFGPDLVREFAFRETVGLPCPRGWG